MKRIIMVSMTFFLIVGCDSRKAVEWVMTTPDVSWQAMDVKTIAFPSEGTPDAVLDYSVTGQTIDGFGACFSELGWLSLSLLDDAGRTSVMKELFIIYALAAVARGMWRVRGVRGRQGRREHPRRTQRPAASGAGRLRRGCVGRNRPDYRPERAGAGFTRVSDRLIPGSCRALRHRPCPVRDLRRRRTGQCPALRVPPGHP